MFVELAPVSCKVDPFVAFPRQEKISDLKQQMALLARQLLDISENTTSDKIDGEVVCLEQFVRGQLISEIAFRKRRNTMFSDGLFAEPAWDMLLDLALARIEKRRISVSSLCIAASVPTTTALRWIKTLLSDGLITREADREDRRRHFVNITDQTYDQIFSLIKVRLQKK